MRSSLKNDLKRRFCRAKSFATGSLALICLINTLQAQELETAREEIPLSLPILQTLIISKEAFTPEALADRIGLITDFLPPFISDTLAQEFLGKEISKDSLNRLRESLLQFLRKEGDYAADVIFQDQDISSGTVVVSVKMPTVEQIEVKGNRWESEEYYQEKVAVEPGDSIDTDRLLTQVAWINRNPFNHMEVLLAPGSKRDTVDVDLLVKDRFVVRPFAGSDNTGTNLTNEVRLFAGANWGKPFGRADLMTYQFTSAPNPNTFYAHTGSYLLFLPWKHELTLFGGYSASRPTIAHFSQEGRSAQASLRYTIPFKPIYGPIAQSVTVGFDYKNLNSNVLFIDASPAIPIIAHQVNIGQLYFGYAWQRKFVAKLELLFSPYHWLPHQSLDRYHALRPHSKPGYIYARAALADSYDIGKKFLFAWTFRAQAASCPLLPSEQFGLGGYDTVRGYLERDFLADNAFCINAEFRAPTISFFKKDELVFLAFTDGGYGYNYQSEESSQTSQYLWSMGGGGRYRIGSYFSIRADYGLQIHHLFGQNTFGRFHLGGYLSY